MTHQKPLISYSLQNLAEQFTVDCKGNTACIITGIAPLDKAKEGDISFLAQAKYRQFLASTQASAVILNAQEAANFAGNCLVTENPQLLHAKVASLFATISHIQTGVHVSAVIGKDGSIANSASVGANCVVGDRVVIAENVKLYPGCVIGDDCVIGEETCLYPNVTLYHQVRIGRRVIIHSGAVLGADGFGLVNNRGIWHKVPQLGGVVIEDDVEIGANTTIDRGALENTVLEVGVKLDNLIHVAHNVRIGAHTAIAATTVIAGSTQIGKHCMIGGGVAISDHLTIADQVILKGKTEVASSITESGSYASGMLAQPSREWQKNIIRFLQLDALARRLQKLEKSIK